MSHGFGSEEWQRYLPIGLIVFRGVFARREEEAIEEEGFAAEQKRLADEAEETEKSEA